MQESDYKLLHAKVPTLLVSLALPMILAQMVNALYNIVDRIYISYIPNIGTTALTGVGICFPILMLISAFSALLGQGGAPLASIRLGAKKEKEAQKILGNCFFSLTICAIILTIVFYMFSKSILFAFGASNETIGYAQSYLHIYLIGTIFVQYSLGLNPFINAQGKTKIGMATVAIGAVLNLLLDPLFIFVFNFGVRGAALTTVISQGVSALWVLRYLSSEKSQLRITRDNFKFDKRIFWMVVSLGISPFIMNSTDSLVSTVFNIQLSAMGGDLYVGAMVVLSSVMQLILMPLNGLNNGAQPIISYNYGAGVYSRVKQAVKTSFMINMSFTILMCVICVFLPQLLYTWFTPDEQLRTVLAQVMPLYYFGIFMFGAQSSLQNAFLSLGQAKVSLILALLRKVILLIPLIYILPMVTNSGVNAVFCAEGIADILAGSTTTVCFLIIGKKILNKPDKKKN